MHSTPDDYTTKRQQRIWDFATVALTVALSLSATGCLSSIHQPSVALSAATAPVVDQAADAYRSVQSLHDLRIDYDAVTEFDNTSPVYNPRKIQPLMSERDVQVRLAVLEAFQCYTKTLVEITNGTSSPQLDAASKSVGESLADLGNTLAPPSAATAIAATTTTDAASAASPPPSFITPDMQNGISTAVEALGQFLVSRTIKKELPQKIREMDPHLQSLCELLIKDIETLQDQERRDYDSIIDRQTLFIRQSKSLADQERRAEIMKLPETVRLQRTADDKLTDLRAGIVRLSLTHHALAADAQANNPESLTAKLSDVAAAGNDLGKYYSSLPASQKK
jgi:hypothetical protein